MENFIVAQLCDNDFGFTIQGALEEGVSIYDHHNSLCPILWKKFIIAFILGQQLKSEVKLIDSEFFDWGRLTHLEEYLRKNLKVTYENNVPQEDHDGGSACIDLHTGLAWCY